MNNWKNKRKSLSKTTVKLEQKHESDINLNLDYCTGGAGGPKTATATLAAKRSLFSSNTPNLS